ncbi:iron ABC transporter permease [Roseomonas sp. HJA6]|uniref:Iron ABC transporter permease n=1 Tax=Roseomonas alba TaxID=2846776 RepID=A0ABS7A912_9PROT|nr:iron ABC transporter permease [Neoroseomonas alba]
MSEGSAGAIAAYRASLRRRRLVLGVLAVIAVAAFLADIAIGPSALSAADALRALFDPSSATPLSRTVVWQARLPPAVMAALVGMALAAAGAEMQTILNNPLASPFTLGVSSAAACGAALAIVLGLTIPGLPARWAVSGNAFLFAFASVALLQLVIRFRGAGVETLVLLGIALVFTFNAIVALIQFVASQDALQQLVFWTLGSLGRTQWDGIALVAIVLVAVIPFSWRAAWRLTVLRLGEERARGLGVDIGALRFAALLRISLLAAVAVAMVGTIGFIGLVAPHVARLLLGEDHRFLLPGSLLCGAAIMSLAASASEMLVPGAVLPLGIVTALVGLPVFILLILGGRRRG